MSPNIKNVLLIGATGNLGPPLIHALSPHFNISVLTRSTTSSPPTFPPSVTIHTISPNYPPSELVSAFTGQDAVISLLRSEHAPLIKRCIDACVVAGVKRYIPGEFGSNSGSEAAREAVPIFVKKWEIRNYLVEKEREGLSWTGVICGAFFDWGLTNRFLGFNLPTHTATLYGSGTIPCQLTLLSDIAQAVVGILLDPAATANRYVYISSFYLTQLQILGALNEATGEEWSVEKRSIEELRKEGFEKVARGEGEGMEDVLVGAHWSVVEGMDYEGEELWNQRLGLEKRDLNDIVKKIVRGEQV